MSNQSSDKNKDQQSQTISPQTSTNPLLNRPSNPNLDITIRKGYDKPTIERGQKPSHIREQKKQE
jgi:hypothetical protein